ncbi:hypothetical protein ABZ570_18415 [Micromonospora sp. NPDC007271]|uniref:hypothetical protein n=1 Tax=Micromonospora sp. NPDC007271 TaxID=3154587 RepID=UPI0033EE0C97
MSDASTDRDDRPAEVSDPLLWRLATAVADTHQPDENGACDNGSCFGAAWPCAAWNRAQEGLRAARGGPPTAGAEPAGVEPAGVEPAGVEPAGVEPAADLDSPAERSTALPRPASRRVPPEQAPQPDRAPAQVTPAA